MEFEELSEFNPEKFASGSETMEKFRYFLKLRLLKYTVIE